MMLEAPLLSVLRTVDSGGLPRDLEEFAADLLGVDSLFVAVVSGGGSLREDFLLTVAEWVARCEHLDMLYSDETFLGADGSIVPVLKPDFDAERLRCQFYLGSVIVYRRPSAASSTT